MFCLINSNIIPNKEDPKEDLEEDSTYYPADGGDDDDYESSDDDDDDEQEASEDDDEEEEHLASIDSSAIPVDDPVPLAEDTKAFKTNESAPTHVPSPRHRTAKMSIRPQTPMAAATEALIATVATALPSSPPPSPLTPLSSLLPQIPSPPLPLPSPPTHTSPTYDEAPLGYRAAEIRLSAASPPIHHPSDIPSPPLLLPSTSHRDDLPKANMSFQKRARFTAPLVDVTVARLMSKEVGYRIEDVWDDMVEDMDERLPTIEDLSQRVIDLATTLARDTRIGSLKTLVATLVAQTSSLQTQLTTTLRRIQTLEAREPDHARDPKP
ncbi:hypothetical protein Tco_1359302 [Tanacetum coccineum]